jgi:uncharacterized membrane protein YraQ (UPF0718 family)
LEGTLLETGRWFLFTTAELVVLFLAISFLVGLLQAWMPEEKVRKLFETRWAITGYFVGAAVGAVTPFCSYSTIPVLSGLLRSGAPFGPTMAFLFASPLLDPVVLGVLVYVVGLEGTIVYTTLTFLASVGVGALLAKLGFEAYVKCEHSSGYGLATGLEPDLPAWRRAWAAAWGFFVPVVPYLLLGTAIGAFIYGFVPTGWLVALAGPDQPLAIPAAAALGVLMYVNAETFFPVATALLDKGVGVGAVVALIVTSMGVSVPEVTLLAGIFRPRLVVFLIASVFFVAITSGIVFYLIIA